MTDPTLIHWVAFSAFVVVMLAADLLVFHRHSHEPTLRESAAWTVVWCGMAVAFDVFYWQWRGQTLAMQFLTGYVVEWSLSMDNVFVFAVIFNYFGVPLKYQYRVLFWGILGAIVMRLSFILAGAWLIHQFEWILYVFGGILIWTGFKLMLKSDDEVHPDRNWLMRFARWLLPVSKQPHGDRFMVVENGRRCITPLFLVLLVVESTDVLFAVDSVPAIFLITNDAFTVFTSNVFAIMGLRALYFLLAGVMDMFRYLNYGLSAVLIFVGGKMMSKLLAWMMEWNEFHIPEWLSLVVIFALLGTSIAASILASRREARRAASSSENAEPDKIDEPDATPVA